MAVDVNSNKYTFLFATVMVVIVATLLALASESLKPMQTANVNNEKRQNILKGVGIEVPASEAEKSYNEYVKEALVLGADGKVKETELNAFNIDVLKDYKSGLSNIYTKLDVQEFSNIDEIRSELAAFDGGKGVNYPLYVIQKDGEDLYVVPLVGTGLWGPIWGYLAISADGKTVVGAVFDHKSETPGLGAEIAQASFQIPFKGKTIFDEKGDFTGIKTVKGGAKGSAHGVDAISGGTITSNGVSEMIMRTLKLYEPYFLALQAPAEPQIEEMLPDSAAVAFMDSLNVEVVDTTIVVD